MLMIPHTMAMLPIHNRAPKRMVMNVLGSMATPNPAQRKMQVHSANGGTRKQMHKGTHGADPAIC